MAYTAGNTILDDEYNAFAASVNTVMSTGSGESGYGQGAISTVSAGTVVSAAQWATLLNKISTAASHQGSSITAISNPVSTDTITAEGALSTNISTITTNAKNAAASGTAITAGGSSSTTATWNGTRNTTQRVTFGSAEERRFFFNAGGRITISYSRSGGSATNKNTGWTALCTACGTINLTGGSAAKTIAGVSYTGTSKKGGSGSTNILLTATGEEDLTGSPVNIFRQYDATSQYTANYITLAALDATATIDLTTTFQDDANANTDEDVNGTLTCTVTVVPPSTSNLSGTWGTPTISTTEAL